MDGHGPHYAEQGALCRVRHFASQGMFISLQSINGSLCYAVQTMSFLAYVIRGANDALRGYQEQIPRAIVRMLQDCPPDATATRKVGQYVCCILSRLPNYSIGTSDRDQTRPFH